ncbi:hypothetical protein Pcinc_034992 [Petrolisthes cinctipes]|uniref:Uncharacterized protein n=1 Tax=Petrolisthes cinctipes TaxID=88211 RepID=A0AAE1BXF4_PETCI|nr:hypothetical protein Pcinc_034992 [Petrolisthes cinctipes]
MHSAATTDISIAVDANDSQGSSNNESSDESSVYSRRASVTMNTNGEPTVEITNHMKTQGKEKCTRNQRAKQRLCSLEKWVRTHLWIFYVVGLILYTFTFVSLLQPTFDPVDNGHSITTLDNTSSRNKEKKLSVNFTQATNYHGEPTLEASFTLSSLSNNSWGLGFDIKNEEENVLYIWLYHRTSTDTNPDPYVSLWVTCQTESVPEYFDNPWKGSWKTNANNRIQIILTKHKVMASATIVSMVTSPFILKVIFNLGCLVCVAVVLGFILTTFWVRYVTVNILCSCLLEGYQCMKLFNKWLVKLDNIKVYTYCLV